MYFDEAIRFDASNFTFYVNRADAYQASGQGELAWHAGARARALGGRRDASRQLESTVERELFCFRLKAKSPDTNTTQVNLRWCLCYCLTAPCDGLSISSRFSQSFTWGGLACYGFWLTSTWCFRRAPRLKVLNFSEHSPLMHLVYRASGQMEVPQWTFKIYMLGNLR